MMVSVRHWDEALEADTEPTNFTVMNEQVYNLALKLQEAVVKDGGIPMLISADQEGGSVYRLNTGTALTGNIHRNTRRQR